MRTTLTLEDPLAEDLRKLAIESGKPFKTVVNDTLRAGLQRRNVKQRRPYQLHPAAMGEPRAGIDLAKALRLADELEEVALGTKLEQRK